MELCSSSHALELVRLEAESMLPLRSCNAFELTTMRLAKSSSEICSIGKKAVDERSKVSVRIGREWIVAG